MNLLEGRAGDGTPEQRRFAVQENTQIRSPTLYALMEEAARVMTEVYSTSIFEPLFSYCSRKCF
jgi:hypothetical protein